MTNIDVPLSRSESSFLENLLKKSNRKDIQEIHTLAKSKQQKNWHSNVFYFAFLCGQTETLKKLFNSSRFELATGIKRVMKQIIIYHAADRGHMEMVQFIIQTQNPGEINYGCYDCSNGNTPLHIASENGHLSICELIIPYLANKNPRGFINGRSDRRSPLDLAALNGHLDVFKLFFENIDDEKNPKNQFCLGETPLHLAAEKGPLNICNFIIQKLENKKNPRDYSNGTPLHRAAKNGFYSICELILQNVRIKCPKDENGVTPLHLAEKYGHLEICQLFEKKPKKRKIR
jgi:ankyrin repeat protein